MDAAGEHEARVVERGVGVLHVDVPKRPVVHARVHEDGGVYRGFHRIEVEAGVQQAHCERGFRSVRMLDGERLLGRFARDAFGDALVHRPRLVVVAAAADQAQRLAVALHQREAGSVARQHGGVGRQREEVVLPRGVRIVVARDQVHRNARLA